MMTLSISWREHFKDQLRDFPSSITLSEALQGGKFSEDEYFSWAQDAFLRPLLRAEFFSSPKGPSAQLWNQWKNSFAWTPSCLPVGVWEDHLLVASLEPQVFPSELKAVLVLAPRASIENLWNQWNSNQKTSMAPSLDLNVELATDGFPEVAENPEVASLDENGEAIEDGSEPLLMPEGLSSENPQKRTESTGLISLLKPFSPIKTDTLTASLLHENPKPALGENPKQPMAAPAVPESEITQVAEGQTKPSHVVAATGVDPTWLELLQGKDINLFNEISQNLFAEMKAYFDQTMVFSYSQRGDHLVALIWDETLPELPSIRTFSLKVPSVLRIVRNTEKPFHGSPVINDFNESFFQNWHSGNIPDHLTITPLMVEGRFVGLVYSSGRKASYNPQALRFAEQKSQEFLNQIIKKIGKTQAA